MKIAMPLDVSQGLDTATALVGRLERAGLDQVWVGESYGYDAPSLMGYLAARTQRVQISSGILPVFTRSPALLAMTAAGLDTLSGGRFALGLGASGREVIEGFHGLRFDRPLARTREIVEICRQVWRRDAPLTRSGPIYSIPASALEGAAPARPLKLIAKPVRADIPIWLAALGRKSVELAAEIADGWLPLFFLPERAREVFGPDLEAGLAKRPRDLGRLEIAAGGTCAIGEFSDVARVKEADRAMAAFYIGGMGAHYNTLVRRYGYAEEADAIRDLFRSGKRAEAAAAVPDSLLDGMSLCGPESYVKERIAAYAEAGVTVLSVTPAGPEPERVIGRLKELAANFGQDEPDCP